MVVKISVEFMIRFDIFCTGIRQAGRFSRINLGRDNEIQREYIFCDNCENEYKNFIALRDMATESELRELTGHTNGVVRAHAFWALILNESNNVFPILIGHLRDNKKIKTIFGCIVDQTSVADFFIQIG